jgi:hypothetical protein
MTPTTDPAQSAPRQRNWAAWLGLLFAFAAVVSNAGLFLGPPAPRLIVWLGVVFTIAAIVCAVIGIMRASRQPQVYGGKVSSFVLGVLSLLICALVALASITSRALPAATNAPQVGQKVPDFTLADTNGNKVSLDQLLGKASPSVPASSNTTGPANSGSLSPITAIDISTTMPTKAVLLVFYRGYW